MGPKEFYQEDVDNDEDYPQNNICYECGKQLKWENMCQNCGVSNLDNDLANEETTNTWEDGNYSTYDPEEKEWLEERLNEVADEVKSVRETTSNDKQHLLKTVNALDENVLTLAKDIDILKQEVFEELQNHIDCIKENR